MDTLRTLRAFAIIPMHRSNERFRKCTLSKGQRDSDVPLWPLVVTVQSTDKNYRGEARFVAVRATPCKRRGVLVATGTTHSAMDSEAL